MTRAVQLGRHQVEPGLGPAQQVMRNRHPQPGQFGDAADEMDAVAGLEIVRVRRIAPPGAHFGDHGIILRVAQRHREVAVGRCHVLGLLDHDHARDTAPDHHRPDGSGSVAVVLVDRLAGRIERAFEDDEGMRIPRAHDRAVEAVERQHHPRRGRQRGEEEQGTEQTSDQPGHSRVRKSSASAWAAGVAAQVILSSPPASSLKRWILFDRCTVDRPAGARLVARLDPVARDDAAPGAVVGHVEEGGAAGLDALARQHRAGLGIEQEQRRPGRQCGNGRPRRRP